MVIDTSAVLTALLVSSLGALVTFGVYREKVSQHGKDILDLKRDAKDFNARLIEYCTKLDERTGNTVEKFVRRKSPLSLTPFGEDLINAINGKKYVLDNKDRLVELIKAKNPKSAYDVQEYARKVIEDLQTNDDFIPFKDHAFKEGLQLEFIIVVLSIFLRDTALPVLGFTPEQIDESDPAIGSKPETA